MGRCYDTGDTRDTRDRTVLRYLLDVFGFLRYVLRRWSEDRCPQVAGSLTFTTLLALVPVFAIVVVILSSMPFFEALMIRLKIFLLLNLVPEIAGKIITVYMEQFASSARRLTYVSLGVLLATSLAVLYTIDRSLNTIWRVRRPRPLTTSIVAYLMLLVLGPVLIALSVTVTTQLYAWSSGLDQLPEGTQPYLLRLVPVTTTAVMLFLLYRLVPNRYVPWRHAALGAAIAAIVFEGMKDGFAAYLRTVPANVVYGAFAAIPAFLLWMYLSWLVVLLGAEITASASYWRGRLWKREPTPGRRFRDALEVGRQLVEAGGTPLVFEAMRVRAGLPPEELEDTLAHLVERGILRRVPGRAFVLAKPASEVMVGDLWRAAARGEGMDPHEWSSYSPDLVDVADALEVQMRRPLTALFEKPAEGESGR